MDEAKIGILAGSLVSGVVGAVLLRSTKRVGRRSDEVTLAMRVRCETFEHRAPVGGEGPCLGELRRRLDAVGGVPRR